MKYYIYAWCIEALLIIGTFIMHKVDNMSLLGDFLLVMSACIGFILVAITVFALIPYQLGFFK